MCLERTDKKVKIGLYTMLIAVMAIWRGNNRWYFQEKGLRGVVWSDWQTLDTSRASDWYCEHAVCSVANCGLLSVLLPTVDMLSVLLPAVDMLSVLLPLTVDMLSFLSPLQSTTAIRCRGQLQHFFLVAFALRSGTESCHRDRLSQQLREQRQEQKQNRPTETTRSKNTHVQNDDSSWYIMQIFEETVTKTESTRESFRHHVSPFAGMARSRHTHKHTRNKRMNNNRGGGRK